MILDDMGDNGTCEMDILSKGKPDGIDGKLDIITIYMNEAGKYPLLTKEQEQELGREIESCYRMLMSAMTEYDQSGNNSDRMNGLEIIYDEIRLSISKENGELRNNGQLKVAHVERFAELLKVSYDNGNNRNMQMAELLCYDVPRKAVDRVKNRILSEIDYELRSTNRKATETRKSYLVDLKKQVEHLFSAERKALNRLINCNLRLAMKEAGRYYAKYRERLRGIDLTDVVQHANLGLIRAAEKFDYRRGNKFSTYAVNWLKQSMARNIADSARTIRIPVHLQQEWSRYYRSKTDLSFRLGREAKLEEIAADTDMPLKKIRKLSGVMALQISLQEPIGDGDNVFGDLLEEEITPPQEETAVRTSLGKHVQSLLGELPCREERVIRMRFGIGEEKEYTLEETGSKFYVTRERARQIEFKALTTLREEKERLEVFVDDRLG